MGVIEDTQLAIAGTQGLWYPGRDLVFTTGDQAADQASNAPSVPLTMASVPPAAGSSGNTSPSLVGEPTLPHAISTALNQWGYWDDQWDYAGRSPFFWRLLMMFSAADITAMSSGYPRIISKENGSVDGYSLLVRATSEGNGPVLCFERKVGSAGLDVRQPAPGLVADTLYDVWLWYDGSNIRMYINKTLVQTTADTRSLPGNANSCYLTGRGRYWLFATGAVAPTTTEMNTAVDAVTTAPTPPPVAGTALVVPATASFPPTPLKASNPGDISIEVSDNDPSADISWTASIAAGPFTVRNASGTTTPDNLNKAQVIRVGVDMQHAALASAGTVSRNLTVESKGPLVTGVTAATTDLITRAAHGLVAGKRLIFSGGVGGAGLTMGTPYYVISSGLTANDFKVALTAGGSAVDITTAYTALSYNVHAEGSPATVAVSVQVLAGNPISVSVAKITGNAVAGSSTLQQGTFQVTSPDGVPRQVKLAEGDVSGPTDISWMILTPMTGTTPLTVNYTLAAAGQTEGPKRASITVAEVTGSPNTDPLAYPTNFRSVLEGGIQKLRWDPVADVQQFMIAYLLPGQTSVPTGQFKVVSPTYDAAANEFVYTPNEADGTGPFPGQTVVYGLRTNVDGSTWVPDNLRPQIVYSGVVPGGGGTAPTGAPILADIAFGGLTTTGVTLSGTVDPEGSPTDVWFEFGPTTAYGTATTKTTGLTGTSPVAFSKTLTGLSAGTTYHARAVAQNGVNISRSADFSFTTAGGSTTPPPVTGSDPQQFGFTIGAGNPSVAIAKGKFPRMNGIRTAGFHGDSGMSGTAATDTMVKEAASRGVYVTLLIQPPYINLGSMTAAQQQEFVNTTVEAVTRYGPGSAWLAQNGIQDGYVRVFELGNEPYGSWFAGTQTYDTPVNYAQMCKAAIIAARKVSPTAKFSVMASNYKDYNPGGGWRNWLQQGMTPYGTAKAGVPDLLSTYADMLSIHCYGEPDQSQPYGWAHMIDWFSGWIDGVNKGKGENAPAGTFGTAPAGPLDGGRKIKLLISEANRDDHLNPANRSAEEPTFISDLRKFPVLIKSRPRVYACHIFTAGRDYDEAKGSGTALLGMQDANGVWKDARVNAVNAGMTEAGF